MSRDSFDEMASGLLAIVLAIVVVGFLLALIVGGLSELGAPKWLVSSPIMWLVLIFLAALVISIIEKFNKNK